MDDKTVYVIGHSPGDEVSKAVALLAEKTARNIKFVVELSDCEGMSEAEIIAALSEQVGDPALKAKLEAARRPVVDPDEKMKAIRQEMDEMLTKASAFRTDRAYRRRKKP